jgi:hypothetical protein
MRERVGCSVSGPFSLIFAFDAPHCRVPQKPKAPAKPKTAKPKAQAVKKEGAAKKRASTGSKASGGGGAKTPRGGKAKATPAKKKARKAGKSIQES